MAICPEKGLSHQHFRCSCCNVSLNEGGEARLCDYYGHYMCAACHHNDLSIIPARVMHNWDFTQRRVGLGGRGRGEREREREREKERKREREKRERDEREREEESLITLL